MYTKDQLLDLFINTEGPAEDAVEQILASPEEYKPFLRGILQGVIDKDPSKYYVRDAMPSCYATVLLGYLRDKKAFPIILEFFQLDPKDVKDLLLSIPHVSSGRILLNTYNGDFEALKSFIFNTKAENWSRSLALEMSLMMAEAKVPLITSEQFFDLFDAVYDNAKKLGPFICSKWIELTCHLQLNDYREDIKWLFKQKLFETYIFKNINAALRIYDGKADSELIFHEDYWMIRNWKEEMQISEFFEDEKYESIVVEEFSGRDVVDNKGTAVSHTERVGRNDPCPCGSGKKYKKCCGK